MDQDNADAEFERITATIEVERLTAGIRALYARCIQGARDNGEYYERVPEAKYELGKAAVWDGVAELLRELVPSVDQDGSAATT